MKPQSSVLLSVLCILLFPGPVLPAGPVTTNGLNTATNTPANTSTHSTVPVTSKQTSNSVVNVIREIRSTRQPELTTRRQPEFTTSKMLPTSVTVAHSTAGTKGQEALRVPVTTIVVLILFFLVLIVMCVCVYKWYSRNLEQHSFRELRRSIVRSVRTSRAAGILERLRPSRKQKDDEVDMEEGGVEGTGEGEEKEGQDEDDDTSEDYSSMDGAMMVTKAKQEEAPEDGSTTSDEQEEEEESKEKTEGAQDDLTKL